MNTQTFDYIVVGASSAGCVIAHRLLKAGPTTTTSAAAGRTASASYGAVIDNN